MDALVEHSLLQRRPAPPLAEPVEVVYGVRLGPGHLQCLNGAENLAERGGHPAGRPAGRLAVRPNPRAQDSRDGHADDAWQEYHRRNQRTDLEHQEEGDAYHDDVGDENRRHGQRQHDGPDVVPKAVDHVAGAGSTSAWTALCDGLEQVRLKSRLQQREQHVFRYLRGGLHDPEMEQVDADLERENCPDAELQGRFSGQRVEQLPQQQSGDNRQS